MTVTVKDSYVDSAAYFASIEAEFISTAAQKKGDALSRATNAFGVNLAISVIPVLPFVWYFVFRFKPSATIFSYHIPIHSFIFWWVLNFLLWGLLFASFSELVKKRNKELTEQQLSRAQMRFAFAFGITKELSDFQKNSRNLHIKRALAYFEGLERAISSILFSGVIDEVRYLRMEEEAVYTGASTRFFPFISPLQRFKQYSWFKLDPSTDKILEALGRFREKIHDRIEDKRELTTVIEILKELALYFYTEIREVPKNEASEEKGIEALRKFATLMEQLPDYSAERTAPTAKEKFQLRLADKFSKFTSLFMHPNLFVCFGVWLIFFACLVLAGVAEARRLIQDLKIDSTIVALLIGAPIASAATLTTISRQRIKSN